MRAPARPKRVELTTSDRAHLWKEVSNARIPWRTSGRVSATDLRRLVQCPLSAWYGATAPFETAAPTLGLAIGEIVHASRADLSRSARARFLRAKSPEDLWSPSIEALNRDLIGQNFDRHVFINAFGTQAAEARLAYTTLLLAMERQRAARGADLLAAESAGANLADQLVPIEVEVPVYDENRDLAGICDEVWRDGENIIPVELKTSPPSKEHQLANRVQAATYGSLFTAASGQKVLQCRVHYLTEGVEDSFEFNRSWERRITHLVSEVRAIRVAPRPPKGRPSPSICGYCSFQAVCPESQAPSLMDSMVSLLPSEAPT